jgi:hypothetical protein
VLLRRRSVRGRRVKLARSAGGDTVVAHLVRLLLVCYVGILLMDVLAGRRVLRAMSAKTAPVRSPTAESESDGEVSVQEVPVPSASRAPARRKGKGRKVVAQGAMSDEVLRLIELENHFQRMGLELLAKAKALREWRVAKYGDE